MPRPHRCDVCNVPGGSTSPGHSPTVPPTPYAPPRDWRRDFENAIGRFADETRIRQFRDPGTGLYLYYVEAGPAHPGKLYARADGEPTPSDAQLATAQRIPGNVDRAGLNAWILDIARRLPIVPYGDPTP